jgi:hypothetical protein
VIFEYTFYVAIYDFGRNQIRIERNVNMENTDEETETMRYDEDIIRIRVSRGLRSLVYTY